MHNGKKAQMKVQLNFNVPKALAKKFRGEAKKAGKTLDSVGTIILTDFFKSWTSAERAAFYKRGTAKIVGRSITA